MLFRSVYAIVDNALVLVVGIFYISNYKKIKVGAGGKMVKKEGYRRRQPGSSGTQVRSRVKSLGPLGYLLLLEGTEDTPQQGGQWSVAPRSLEFPKPFRT